MCAILASLHESLIAFAASIPSVPYFAQFARRFQLKNSFVERFGRDQKADIR